ncbi:unnamed protein product [Urochloa humidicola]
MTNRSESTRRKQGDEQAAAASFPPWVMLEPCEVLGFSSSTNADSDTPTPASGLPTDTPTPASGHTTRGLPIAVSLRLAAPPEESHIRVHLPVGVVVMYTTVLAAHGDSVLIHISGNMPMDDRAVWADNFVYNAGDAAAVTPRPPSLLLLPDCNITDEHGREILSMDCGGTGFMRHGEDDFIVATLNVARVVGTTGMDLEAELCLFRSGKWSVTRHPIRCYDSGGEFWDLPFLLNNSNKVVTIGDRLLCWVNLSHGLLFANVLDMSPGLCYVAFPMDLAFYSCYHNPWEPLRRNVCVTAGGSAIKLIDIFPRCCCGSEGRSSCPHSKNACTVRTWTLSMDDMTWLMDGVLDSTQLWALDGYRGLPRAVLYSPVVSLDDPHAICFEVFDGPLHEEYSYMTMWRIMVDMRSKMIQSIFCYPEWVSSSTDTIRPKMDLVTSRVSNYFNSKQGSSEPDPALAELKLTTKKIKLQVNNALEPVVQPPWEVF